MSGLVLAALIPMAFLTAALVGWTLGEWQIRRRR